MPEATFQAVLTAWGQGTAPKVLPWVAPIWMHCFYKDNKELKNPKKNSKLGIKIG